ncbi:hypothetical protein BAMA_12520 [Bacillus manliponensis]|uniref:Uncharacterized protein n=1 Tax=Bacillus manliponensis TaxID=574376 RepID=A0A073JTB4_9BACI|nr:hypothetical protein [Bacillus manliponensis]KEK17555.1 hypothetical protein BAMA_12520 [Bacillus manliponensis]
MLIKPEAKQLTRFWIPMNHLGFRTQKIVEGEYIGEHNGVHLMIYFNEELCMHVVSEATTGYGIVNSFNPQFAIKKAKRRIDTNKERVDLWINATNAKFGALNDIISVK